jgi:hypothetical protein
MKDNSTPFGPNQKYMVLTASTTPASTCRGTYARVGLAELEPGFAGRPKMISDRARGVVRIVATWENCNVGKTDRCAFHRAIAEAEKLAETMRATQ